VVGAWKELWSMDPRWKGLCTLPSKIALSSKMAYLGAFSCKISVTAGYEGGKLSKFA